MHATVTRTYDFEAAHRLPQHPGRCARLHGHTYSLEVSVTGPIDPGSGMVLDFGVVDAVVEPILAEFDHAFLNDLIPNPTCELVALELLRRLDRASLPIAVLRLHETRRGSVSVTIPDLANSEGQDP